MILLSVGRPNSCLARGEWLNAPMPGAQPYIANESDDTGSVSFPNPLDEEAAGKQIFDDE